MQQIILAGNQPYPNPNSLVPGLLGAYLWAEGFNQDEGVIQVNLIGFVNFLGKATGTAAMANVMDVEGFFDAICRAEEPMILLAMTALDEGCM
eukprot:12651198-Ditylum_brightwellii.AAC.1